MRILVIQDFKENRRKCSLTPLEGREDVSFLRLGHPARSPAKVTIPPCVLLEIEAPPLSSSDAGRVSIGDPLVIVDSTWIRLPAVLRRLDLPPGDAVLRRSIPAGIRTAYPRTSKLHRDPEAGLASVEALFAATVALGEPRLDLLRDYHWAAEFVAVNLDRWRALCPSIVLDASADHNA